jgi:polyhydroxyalkanoate synthesis regulator phasin
MKEILYAGLGGALLLKEKIEDELEKVQEKGRLSKEEAKTFMENIQQRGEEAYDQQYDQLKSMLREIVDELGLATKADIEALKDPKA